ncbi:unnamed protein product [Lymnaea stagnalis]|uniref:Tetraspanin n=1 Tax=Lymnaea stagnalis TaxID=6523 RepID=A0AAV2H628_LYMST
MLLLFIGFFVLIALTCIAGGAVLLIGRTAYGSDLQFLRDDLTTSAKSMGLTTLDVSALDVIFITIPLGVVLVIFGVLITAICILGIIAGSGQFYKFVIVYLVLISCLYFTQIVVIICAYIDRTPFDTTVKQLLKLTLESYTGDAGKDSITLGWNAIMSYKKCCGVDGYEDFAVATGWTKVALQQTPRMCCITKAAAFTCTLTANYQTQTYYNRGCYDHIWDYVTSNTGLIIFTVFFIVLLEFLCIFFASWILCNRRSKGPTKVGHYSRYN